MHLPAHTERLRIGYTATSLSMPERVRFRYRMEGIDTRWRDAGTEREAVYTDPPPGTYRFQVTAANEDGVWNEEGASISIVVAPTFFETTWFVVICLVVAFAALWLAFYARMRRMEAQLRARLHERHAERERIARELHDTLLQSIQGLTMRFQAIANRVPADQPLRAAMEGALDRAEEALVEARDRVRDLRGHVGESSTLDVALIELARVYATEHTVPVLVDAVIDMRDMDPLARDELYGIAREAVHNAIAHAEASRIDVVIGTEGAELVLRVRDDGRGIDDAVLRGGGRAGHWGLRGIQERAHTLGGTATFSSRADGGTEVTVRTPMNRIFPSRGGWWRRWWRERAS